MVCLVNDIKSKILVVFKGKKVFSYDVSID